jgi:gluconolactonase
MTPVRDAVAELRTLASGIDHPESVGWWDGAVWCGTEGGRFLRIDPTTGAIATIAETDGFLLGFAFDAHGRCYICDNGKGRVLRVGQDGFVETVADTVEGRRLVTPNYPVFASDGTLYVTDSGTGWDKDDGFLFRISPAGDAEIISEECRQFPNGLALSADERTLFVVESRLPGIVTYSLDGSRVGPRQELMRMPGTVPDGLALDADGVLYIGCWRPDRVYRLATGGDLEIYLDDPTAEYLNSPTNLCFGGDGLSRLYFAGLCGWSITEIDTTTTGQKLAYPHIAR